jgi:hypothetical protein
MRWNEKSNPIKIRIGKEIRMKWETNSKVKWKRHQNEIRNEIKITIKTEIKIAKELGMKSNEMKNQIKWNQN